MDLHVYRNSQDRWHDLRSVARECGAVLALNAVTLEELVERLTPDLKAATAGQRLAVIAAILKRCERKVGGPSPSGRGRRDSLIEAGAPGEGHAKREPDRAKPQEKSSQILRPSPYPLPEGEGESSAITIFHRPS